MGPRDPEYGRADHIRYGNMRIKLFGLGHDYQGILHVVGPEFGITQPGLVIAGADSHTSTHGALGAYAFGIGSSEVAHVLATQTLWRSKPKTLRVTILGERKAGVSSKDLILFLIRTIGSGGAVGYAVEYSGDTIDELSVEARMTVCNMSIEAGARAGLIAPDQKVFDYMRGKPMAPTGSQWGQALEYWQTLRTEPGSVFNREVQIEASEIAPQVTWGTNPEMVADVTGVFPIRIWSRPRTKDADDKGPRIHGPARKSDDSVNPA